MPKLKVRFCIRLKKYKGLLYMLALARVTTRAYGSPDARYRLPPSLANLEREGGQPQSGWGVGEVNTRALGCLGTPMRRWHIRRAVAAAIAFAGRDTPPPRYFARHTLVREIRFLSKSNLVWAKKRLLDENK